MPDVIALETYQAMQSLQLSMSYSTAVEKKVLDSQEQVAQLIEKMMPPVVPSQQHIIDTYA